jgi:hypothetical protein
MATRKVRTPDELQGATVHLIYEVQMARAAAHVLTLLPIHNPFDKNVYIEALANHARALVHFMFPEHAKPDDVLAEDYFDNPNAWNKARGPTMPTALDKVRGRVGKEIVHLTYARLSVTDQEKGWNPAIIIDALDKLLKVFADYATRLDASAKDQIGKPGIYGMKTGSTGPVSPTG